MASFDVNTLRSIKEAIHVHNSLTEVTRWRHGEVHPLTKKEYLIHPETANLRRSGIIHRKRITVEPTLATGVPDYKTTLPQLHPVGTVVELAPSPHSKRFAVILKHTKIATGNQTYLRTLKTHEINAIKATRYRLRPISTQGSPLTPISEGEGLFVGILNQVDKIRTLFFQAILRFLLLDDTREHPHDHLFIRIYLRILAVATIFFVITFMYVILFGGGLEVVFLHW